VVGINSNEAAAERASLFVNISCKFPLWDSRIGDNVKKRGWSLGWVLSGATPRLEGKIFFSFRLRKSNPNKRDDSLSCR
jgi:hypothetical protein